MRYSAALVCAALIGIAGTSAGSTVAADEGKNTLGFNFDTGNIATEVIFPATEQPTRVGLSTSGMDATTIFRLAALVEAGWFDAIAPYHPTAIGLYSNLGRRPASEAVTNKNKNIALMYASYRALESMLPKYDANWRAMMESVGLDPDDDQENTTTPIGIGNLAGNTVVKARLHDGMNQLGDEGGVTYNRKPYADWTGYKPVNSAYQLNDPSHYQPGIETQGNGSFKSHIAVTPQMGVTAPFTDIDPTKYVLPVPASSNARNKAAYKKQVDEVLAASASLTDRKKVNVEFFNDKFLAFGRGTLGVTDGLNVSLDEFVHRFAASNVGGFDTLIPIWRNKYMYDTVRPFTAIRYVYGDKKVTAWGGVGKGTVRDIPASQWTSYAPVTDHPEYPSGSTSLCAELAEVNRLFKGTDKVDVSYTYPKGSSVFEPGLTPAQDITLHWDTGTDFVNDCAQSRIDGGVHFRAATEASKVLGTQVGKEIYTFFKAHIDGTMGPSPVAKPIAPIK
ncbi:vanadium-dependent haloperoxidase [Streptomyces sp.]|uniref:vanadium-dependent haloperoxidase n=1 Tax=Streptomyces sp. TaxID=1931 RepID=UPI002F428A0E